MKTSIFKKKFLLLIPGIVLLNISTQISKADVNTPFIVFDNANSEIPYRIPAIACTPEGDLIAVADYRYSKQDIGVVPDGKLDLRYRIKDHKTGEWGEIKTLAAAKGEGADFTAFGDPCIVADSESPMVLVTSCSGNVSYQRGDHENHQGWASFLSTDGGNTWVEKENLEKQVFDQLDSGSNGEISCFFIGSGKISQSPTVKVGDAHRLYCAALVKTNKKEHVNYVFFSDDFGKNWKLLGEVDDCPILKGNEPKADELPDGSVLLSSRVSGGRVFNVFHFSDVAKGKGKWDKPAFSSPAINGVRASRNACNGEILIMPAKDTETGEEVYVLLQSVPFGPDDRSNVGINYKVLADIDDYATSNDIANNWNGAFQVTDKTSAYSTMTADKNNNIAFLYEENVGNHGYDIVYKDLSLEEITGGKYVAIP